MYLSKKQIAALGIICDVVESYLQAGWQDEEVSRALDVIIDMLHSAKAEEIKRAKTKGGDANV